MATKNSNYRQLLLSFNGRISRYTYWMEYYIPVMLLYIVVLVIDVVIFGTNISTEGEAAEYTLHVEGGPLSTILSLALIYPSLAVTTKRWHDRDKSGWWSLILLIPIAGGIWFFVELGCLPGTSGPNRFGADPLNRAGFLGGSNLERMEP
jgi:uncharacterized membrane protein YhaH (DUF805 family)